MTLVLSGRNKSGCRCGIQVPLSSYRGAARRDKQSVGRYKMTLGAVKRDPIGLNGSPLAPARTISLRAKVLYS